MDPRLLEHFNEITNILKNREEPVDIFLISEKFKISIKQAKLLLNNFISQKNLLAEYNVIFSAEILEENKLKTVLVPSFSPKLKEIIGLRDNLVHLGVFAVYKKEQVNLLKDYSVFVHEYKKVVQTEITQQEKENRNIQSGKVSSNTAQVNKNVTSTAKPTTPNSSTSLNFGKNNTKTPSANNSTNKSNVGGTNQNSAKSLAKAFDSKVSINKDGADLSDASSAGLAKGITKCAGKNVGDAASVKEIKATIVEVSGEDNDVFGEENYYGGGAVNKAVGVNPSGKSSGNPSGNPSIDPSIDSSGDPVNSYATGKRKYNEISSDGPAVGNSKIKKDLNGRTNVGGNRHIISDSSEDEADGISGNVKSNIYNSVNNNVASSGIADPSAATEGPKKIKKIKKVKKTNTYMDEKGYMRTVDEWEDEEYWTDEKPKLLPMNNNGFSSLNQGAKKPAKKVAQGQSNLLSFFGGK
jgi:hypothetical protein